MIAAFRKHLSAPGLLKSLRSCFHKVSDHRPGKVEIALVDALMSGLAVFGLKYSSLLYRRPAYDVCWSSTRNVRRRACATT
jgi:hypothetical protein